MGMDGTRTTGYGSGPATRAVPEAGSGAMTSGLWPRATRCSATRTTECATPLMSGGDDSVMIVTRMLAQCGGRQCGKPRQPDLSAKNELYLVPIAWPDQPDRPGKTTRRGLVRRRGVTPRADQMGQQELPNARLGRRLARLPTGQVQVRRVVPAV